MTADRQRTGMHVITLNNWESGRVLIWHTRKIRRQLRGKNAYQVMSMHWQMIGQFSLKLTTNLNLL